MHDTEFRKLESKLGGYLQRAESAKARAGIFRRCAEYWHSVGRPIRMAENVALSYKADESARFWAGCARKIRAQIRELAARN
jgi:hypothetical protein